MSAPTAPPTPAAALTPAMRRALATLARDADRRRDPFRPLPPYRLVPVGTAGYAEVVNARLADYGGERYGRGCGRHTVAYWQIAINDQGRAALDGGSR